MEKGLEWLLRNCGVSTESCEGPVTYNVKEWTLLDDCQSLWHHAPTGCTFRLTANLDTRQVVVKLEQIEDGKTPDFWEVANAARAIFAMRDFPEDDAPSTRLRCHHKKPALG